MSLFRLELSSSTHIAASRERVWQVFADIRRWTEWCGVCLRADVDEGFGWRVGERIRLRLRMARVGVPFDVGITEADPGNRVAWASAKLTVTAVRAISFESASGGVAVTDHKLFTSPVLPIWTFYPRPIIRSMTESWLADLKRECERSG